MIYESWKYQVDKMNFTTYDYEHGADNNTKTGIEFADYSPNGLWEIIGIFMHVQLYVVSKLT